MGSAVKASPASGSNPRPKKALKSMIVTLKLSPKSLVRFEPDATTKKESVKKEPESKPFSSKSSSTAASNTLPAATSSPGENASDSNSNTPAPSGTDDSTTMPPPTEGAKKSGKTGFKRSSAQSDGLLKPRGKPGPKKKPKVEDSVPENVVVNPKAAPPAAGPTAAHKLGPKANQGAINAGLRALDRSGKPCRKWQKGSFQVKTFTGTVWEIPRWRAPPRLTINGESEEATTSESSSKENKESSRVDSEKSNSAADIDLGSTTSIHASSPAPAIAASG